MFEMVALQNVVVEHKRSLAVAIAAELTKQVQSLGLPDALVWISFDGKDVNLPTRAMARKAMKNGKKAKVVKAGPDNKVEKKAHYMCNYWRKKKGLAPLSMDAWKAEKSGKPAAKEAPKKN
jgi:uncharacterized protein YkwD